MTNIADLLRNAKKGTILWSPLFGPVEFMQLGKNDQIWVRIDNSEPFDKYGRYFGSRFPEAECQLFPSKDYRTWQGWTPCVEPKFKPGTWLWHKTKGVFPMMIEDYDEKEGYLMQFTDETKCYFGRDIIENDYRLWTIQDARNGDVLVASDESLFIFARIKDNAAYYHYSLWKNGSQEISDGKHAWEVAKDCHPATKEQRDLLFAKMKEAGYEWDADKKELRKIIKPMFKVGDWITDGNITVQIEDIRNNSYIYSDGVLYSTRTADKVYHLWSIADAKDGDVLVLNGFSKEYKWIGIFKALTSDTSFSSHCHYNCGMCEFITDIARCTKHGIKYNDIRLATNEERDILFAKMRESGYTWDENKKELKKFPKKHYDISSFHAGMPVLVRADNVCRWNYSVFSHITGNKDWQFAVCNGVSFTQCIPFEGNETLLGTSDMCNERFVNW